MLNLNTFENASIEIKYITDQYKRILFYTN